MTDFTPIPIPFRQRWRHFRTRFLPVIVFAAAAAATAWVWEQKSAPTTMVGEAYAPHGIVTAAAAGILEEFAMQPYEEVRQGQPIAQVRTVPSRIAEHSLAALRAEIELIRIGAGEPVLEQQRNALSWQGLRRDWMLARSELALIKIQKRQAELELSRYEKLQGTGAASQTDYEQSRALFEGLAAEESEKERLARYLEEAVNTSTFAADGGGSLLRDGLAISLDWKAAELARLEEELKPVPLLAPFDGRITRIHRREGDFVGIGESVVEVGATRPDFIIGYVRQPVVVPLEVGMAIEVTLRRGDASVAKAELVSIGPRFEALGEAFRRPVPILAEERALPLLISLPAGVALRPGEIVDLRVPTPDA